MTDKDNWFINLTRLTYNEKKKVCDYVNTRYNGVLRPEDDRINIGFNNGTASISRNVPEIDYDTFISEVLEEGAEDLSKENFNTYMIDVRALDDAERSELAKFLRYVYDSGVTDEDDAYFIVNEGEVWSSYDITEYQEKYISNKFVGYWFIRNIVKNPLSINYLKNQINGTNQKGISILCKEITTITRGEIPISSGIHGKQSKTAIAVGHLSNKAILG